MTDDQIRSAMRELADGARPAKAGLAETVLRRARKRRDVARASVAGGSVLAVAAVAGLVFATPWNGTGGQAIRQGDPIGPAGTPDRTASAKPKRTCMMADDVRTEKDESGMIPCPSDDQAGEESPEDLDLDPIPEPGRQVAALQVNGTWYLTDEDTGELKKSKWSWVTVSPDGTRYAVLEKKEDASRVGIVDRASGEVEHWINNIPAGTGQVYWSPTSDQLVGTHYIKPGGPTSLPRREGAFIVEVDDADSPVRDVPVEFNGGHVDYSWSNAVFWNGDGSGLVASYTKDQGMTLGIRLLSLDGDVEKSIPDTGALTPGNGIATSPDNRYAMTEPNKTKNHVIDLETGEVVENTRSFGAEVWLDNDRFIGDLAWTEITSELAVIETDGTVVERLWKAPKDVVVDALAVSLAE